MVACDKQMISRELMLLALLQHADSFFPGGSASFSLGLEGIGNDGFVRSATSLRRYLEGQIRYRWATCDRSLLVAAHRAHHQLDHVAAVDRLAEAVALPRELREGSTRSGTALLGMHQRLDTPGATQYAAFVNQKRAVGHLAVVQGLMWARIGLSERSAETAAVHGLCIGTVGAAVRLGIVGHVDAQRILTDMRHMIAVLLTDPVLNLDSISAFTPLTDIGLMRHESQALRLFAN
jgi:urease accessory protein